MRALVDMNDAQIDALDTLAKRVRQSRAALIRAAIDDYLAPSSPRTGRGTDSGLWGEGRGRWPGLPGKDAPRMVGALFDTNILIDHLNAVPHAREEIRPFRKPGRQHHHLDGTDGRGKRRFGRADPAFPRRFQGHRTGRREIAARAVELRRAHRMKPPDAVIWATAQTTGRLLVTRNTKDFPPDDPGVREPYTL